MSALEPVPVDDPHWEDMDEVELEETLQRIFDEITWTTLFVRSNHNSEGFYADVESSESCRALGHVEVRGIVEPQTEHVLGWNNESICLGTRFGTACTECEGECELPASVNLWALPGVRGRE